MNSVNGCHHVTLCVGGAAEDVEFHVKTLGLRFIKRTVLFDGNIPIYHLYYSNAHGDPSAVITTFPFAQAGIWGRRGTNQARDILLSVPAGSIDFWRRRLNSRGFPTTDHDIFDTERLSFFHPSGAGYTLVAVEGDQREGYTGNGIPREHAIHGVYGVGVNVHTPDLTVDFLVEFLSGDKVIEKDARFAIDTGTPDEGGKIELIFDRDDDQGTWTYSGGTVHHFAFNAVDLANQDALKYAIEGAGYTDISELKDRKYFKSVYVRSPGGLLCELAVTHPEGGWACDEALEELGSKLQLPPQFESRRSELVGRMESIDV